MNVSRWGNVSTGRERWSYRSSLLGDSGVCVWAKVQGHTEVYQDTLEAIRRLLPPEQDILVRNVAVKKIDLIQVGMGYINISEWWICRGDEMTHHRQYHAKLRGAAAVYRSDQSALHMPPL